MNKPYVIAIAGGTCSGKSTLSDQLEASLSQTSRVKAIHMDAYFKKEPPTTLAPITRTEYVEHNHPDTLELHRMYADFQAACNDDAYDVLIIEGLFALYLDSLREAADFKVFVDLDSDARLTRRIVKHMGFGQTYEQVTNRYLETVKFRHNELIEPTRWHADVVLNGTLDTHQGADVILAFLREKLQGR